MHQPEQPEEDAQWRQSRKLETVGRMVGSVAHDFANLLTLIAGYSERLLKCVSERDPLRGELDEIRKAASRGSRLTAGLLSFARGQSVEPRQLDLNALIVGLESMLRPIAGERIELEMRLPPDLGAVVADPGQMEQVIVNLVLNARDAMPGGGRLVIETSNHEIGEQEAREHSAEPGPAIQLSVTDTGHGMDAGTLERLFDPFFTTKDKGRGTGLGLSTVRSIVRESRGQVWAVSVPGHGAVFTVWLPRMRPAPAAHLAALPRRPGAVAGGDETILLVEDEENVRRLLRHVLETRGYCVLEAPHAEGALRLFEQRPGDIDLLLTDMVLPRMSGRELAERARTIRPGLEVIYMSGYAADDLMRTGAFGPGISILEKPLRPDVLEACVREALDHRARVDSQAG